MFELSIITPEGVRYENEVERVVVPTKSGEITILKKHTPLVSSLRPGVLTVGQENGERHLLAVSGGLVEVRASGRVIILADTAERAEDIDLERAKEARKRAEEFMEREDIMRDEEHAILLANLQKELARIRASELYTNRK